MSGRNALVVALAAALATGGAAATARVAAQVQIQTSGQTQPRPTFRSGVDLVTVDVAVLNGSGHPIEGLSADDFELAVNGSKRRIVWAEFVRHGSMPHVSVSADHYSTNEGSRRGRLVVLAVDQAHIRRVEGRAALRAAAEFVDSLDADDRVAAASLGHAEALNFTTEHTTVKRHLERLSGTATASQVFYNIGLSEALSISEGSRIVLEQVVRRECGASLSRLTDMRRLAEAEGAMDPCPAQVELEGRTLAQQARTDARISIGGLRMLIARLAEIEGPKTVVLISEGLTAEPQLFDLSALGAAAHAAQVTIYVLQLETPLLDASDARLSPTVNADRNILGDGLARVAGTARGAMFRLVGADPQPFRRILSELSGHYILAFEPLPADRDSASNRLDVKVRTGGAIVRARPSFSIPGAPQPETIENELVRLLRDPRTVTELPLRVATHSYRQPEGAGIKTIIAAETSADQDVTIGYVVVNRNGIIAASGAGTAVRGRYVVTVAIPDGNYMLKVAIIDRAFRRGSVERHFNVRLGKAGSAPMGDLMLAEPAAGVDLALQPVVASLRGNELVVYLELYAEDSWVERDDAVTVAVVSDEVSSAPRIPPVVERTGPARWTVTARAPLQNLDPGARLVLVTVSPPGAEPVRLSRAFSIDRR